MKRLIGLAKSEPVRLYVYGVGTALEAYLVARGIITSSDAPYVAGIITAVLLVPAVEGSRSQVTPVDKGQHEL